MSKKDPDSSPDEEGSTQKSSQWTPEDTLSNLIGKVSGVTSSAISFAKKTGGASYKVGKAIVQSQDQLKLMVAAGQSLKDLREVAGLTVNELNDTLNLKDKTILEAVENGTATLSFELILRLAALLARNDPVPFILKYSRAYAPDTWKILNDWGAGRLPLHYERERQFINIYRSQDDARKLSDEGYAKVLEFTKQAFNLSLHFVSEQENAIEELKLKQEEQLSNLKNASTHTTSPPLETMPSSEEQPDSHLRKSDPNENKSPSSKISNVEPKQDP